MKTQKPLTLEEKRELCVEKVTLNGHRAALSRYNSKFALVTDLDSGLSGEWAWLTVLHVINFSNGSFHS
jgi:hypothetical protein